MEDHRQLPRAKKEKPGVQSQPRLGVGRLCARWGEEAAGKAGLPEGAVSQPGLFGSQRGNPQGAAERRRGPRGCRQERAASF